MNRRQLLSAAGATAISLPFAGRAEAAQLSTVRVERSADLPLVRPNWPVPSDPYQEFFIQRSTNKNTIVFAARYDEAGDVAGPDIYWRRYANKGQKKPLNTLERLIASGIRFNKRTEPNAWNVIVRPMQRLNMVLVQTAPFEAQLIGMIGGERAQPVYCYAEIDESGLIPSVTALSMHGRLPGGGAISEYYSVAGGEIR